MYAVIAADGKQYRVAKGDVLELESVHTVAVGTLVDFDNVLLLNEAGVSQLGNPHLPNVKVVGKIRSHKRGKKVIIIKFKRRKGYMRRAGFRADLAVVEIVDIVTPSVEKETPKVASKTVSKTDKAGKTDRAGKKTGVKATTSKKTTASTKKTTPTKTASAKRAKKQVDGADEKPIQASD